MKAPSLPRANPVKAARRVPQQWRVPLWILLATTVYAFWVTRHVWSGIPGGQDSLGHIVRTNFALKELFPHFRTDGWLFQYGTGSRPFETYGPGYAMTIGLIRLATLGQLSTVGSVAFLGVVSYAAVPWSVAFFTSRLKFPPLACATAGVLALCIESNFGGGLTGLYDIGLLPNTYAIPLFFFTLGSLLWLWEKPRRLNFSICVIFISVLLLTHQISVLSLAICLPILARYAVVTYKASFERVQWIWLVGVTTIGLTLFWFLPAVGSTPEHGAVVTLARPTFSQFWHSVWTGHAMASMLAVRLALLSWVIVIWRAIKGKESFSAVIPIILSVTLVFVSYLIAALFGNSDISLELPNRAFAYIGLFGIMPLGLVCYRGFDALRNLPNTKPYSIDIVAVSLALLLIFVFTTTKPQRNIRQTYTKVTAAFAKLVKDVDKKTPPTGRILFQRDNSEYEDTGIGTPPRWMVWKNNHWNLHMFGWETSPAVSASDLADRFGKTDASLDAPLLRRFGVASVVAYDDGTIEKLDADTKNFAFQYEDDPFRVYKVLPAQGNPQSEQLLQQVPSSKEKNNFAPNGNLTVSTVSSKFNHVYLRYAAEQKTNATAAITWSRGWHAYVDGKEIPVLRTNDSIIQLALPAGNHRLTFEYSMDIYTRIGQLISLFAIIIFIMPSSWLRRITTPKKPTGNKETASAS